MKIKFVGVGSAFTTQEYYQSNLLITSSSGKKMLVDCGTDIRFALSECDPSFRSPAGKIDAVYISHLHSDHIGGMEWLAFETYFAANPKRPVLFMEENIMHEMWETSLKAGLGCIEGKCMHLTDYFKCKPVNENNGFVWEDIRFSLVKMPHVITGYKNFFSFGLMIQTNTKKFIFFTTDTQFCPDIITEIGQKVEIIFHDCETILFKSVVHANYDDLITLPANLRKKIWLYHYQPQPNRQPEKDGFKGFVIKGQEFDFD